MYNNRPYVMRDQVKNLVPSLMELSVQGMRKPRGRITELAIFAAVTLGYLVVLGLTA